jgi:hypothetical protein
MVTKRGLSVVRDRPTYDYYVKTKADIDRDFWGDGRAEDQMR